MNLTKLFEAQRVLDERIEKEHPRAKGENRLESKSLALLVELGEAANEYRGFKFWSNNQSSREGLLGELVDCLHFMLSIGNEVNAQVSVVRETMKYSQNFDKPTRGFNLTYFYAASFAEFPRKITYYDLWPNFITLVKALGFTTEQLETAYYEKNKINHERQDGGY